MKRLTATIYGRVQGVSFRYYTQLEARRLGLTGWVRNEWDGSVRVVADGPNDALNSFLRWLHVGPRAARVDNVQISWSSALNGFETFEIRW